MSWFNNLPKYCKDWNELSKKCKERDGNRCRVCGATSTPENRLNACHIVSKSQGGKDELSNLITKCEKCHSSEKGHAHMKVALSARNKKTSIINIKPL